ncbi:MAG: hypothetical protein JXR53_15930 [Bacteroidales bacterium]|nr:hypothetical protein [Bacteroidales bacterium]
MPASILHGKIYHIYNRGNKKEDVFLDDEDFVYFLDLYQLLIGSIADTHSWVLMKNHFHFLIQVKDFDEIGYLNPEHATSEDLKKKWSTSEISLHPATPGMSASRIKPNPINQFRHLFSIYTMYFNKKYNETGSVFQKKYKRKLIENNNYLKEVFLYINNNPVKHKICKRAIDYKWSSIHEIMGISQSRIITFELFEQLFGDEDNFMFELNRFSLEEK